LSYITPIVRSKRIAAGVAAALLGTGVALALGEVGVRIAGIAPPLPVQYGDNVPDDVIAFRRRPGSTIRGRSESGEFAFEYTHNDLGFRDSEHALGKPAGTVRIVALGDSFTYGVGADFDDTYPAQVERRLNQRAGGHPRVEVIKLGLPRHFPLLERRTLERDGLRFAPDVVLVTVLPNDVVDTERGLDAVCVAESGYLVPCAALAWNEAAVWLYQRSAAARVVVQRWSRLSAAEAGGTNGSSPHESAWQALERELAGMQRAARDHGAALVVVALPQQPPWSAADADLETRLARWGAAHDAVFIPTLAALRAAASSPPLYWQRDGHCTAAGYAVIADAVVAALIAHGLTP